MYRQFSKALSMQICKNHQEVICQRLCMPDGAVDLGSRHPDFSPVHCYLVMLTSNYAVSYKIRLIYVLVK